MSIGLETHETLFAPNIGNAIQNDMLQLRIGDLEQRCRDLEDCLQELVPFASCSTVDMQANFSAPTKEQAELKGWAFKRDTIFMDQRIFRKIEKLMRKQVSGGA